MHEMDSVKPNGMDLVGHDRIDECTHNRQMDMSSSDGNVAAMANGTDELVD